MFVAKSFSKTAVLRCLIIYNTHILVGLFLKYIVFSCIRNILLDKKTNFLKYTIKKTIFTYIIF